MGQKDPLEKEMQPTPVFLPRKSHGWHSLVGYSPWGCKSVGHNLVTKKQTNKQKSYSIHAGSKHNPATVVLRNSHIDRSQHRVRALFLH